MVGPGGVAVAMVWPLGNGLQLVEGAARNEAYIVFLSFLPSSSRTEQKKIQLAISFFSFLVDDTKATALSLSLFLLLSVQCRNWNV